MRDTPQGKWPALPEDGYLESISSKRRQETDGRAEHLTWAPHVTQSEQLSHVTHVYVQLLKTAATWNEEKERQDNKMQCSASSLAPE